MADSRAEKKGWYPGKFIDEIKEKRKSREVDKATVDAALAAAAAAAAAPAPQTAPDSPTDAAVTATDAKVAEDVVAAEPVAPQAADPLGAEAAAVHESQEAEADSAAKSGGWAPGKFINKAKEHRAAAKTAKHESTASTDSFQPVNELQADEQQAAVEEEEVAPKEQPAAEDAVPVTGDQDDAGSNGEKEGWTRGKYLNKLREKRAEAKGAAADQSDDAAEGKETSRTAGWHPGKLIQQAKETRSQRTNEDDDNEDDDSASTDGEHKGRLLSRLRERFVASRKRSERSHSVSTPLCQVTITVQDVREVQATRPYLEVGLQGTTCHSAVFSPDRGLDTPFRCSFSISDITTDVYLYVMEEYTVRHQNHCVGQVILPLVRYLTLKEALPPRSEWVEIFPLGPEGIYGKHRSGVEKVPGSAMPHVPSSLGYVQVQVELHLTDPAAKAYFEGEVFDLRNMHDDRDEDGDVQIVPRVMKYNAARLKRALSSPPLLKLLTSFPGSLVLVFLGVMVPLFGQLWHLPWLFGFAVIVNGALVKTERTFNHVILWDNEVGKSDKSALGKLRQLKGLFGALQEGLGKIATLLEKNSNIWSWADPQVTTLAVGVLLGVCLVLSLLMRIVPIRLQLLLVSLAVTGGVLAKSVKPPAASTAVETDSTAPNPIKARIGHFMQRVPDSLELEHRYICETAIERGHKYATKRLKN